MDKPIPPSDRACALVVTTLPGRDAALAIGRRLVESRVAACVQLVDGLVSIYRWHGAIEESAECQLVAKTAPERVDALIAALRDGHPYELPEIVVLDGTASAAYAAWVRAETIG